MKKTGNRGLKEMFGIGKFVASQAVNSGRTLVVSFQRLHLVLGGRGCGRRKRNKIKIEKKRKRRSIRENVDLYEVC